MSHMTDVKLKVKDLDALEEAALALGMELRRGQKTHKWYGQFMGDTRSAPGHDPKTFGKCEHAIAVKGEPSAYEVGVVKALDGDGFELLFDSWGPGQRVEAKAGRNLARLRQEYAVAVTAKRVKQTLARQGFKMTREAAEGGRVRLRLRAR